MIYFCVERDGTLNGIPVTDEISRLYETITREKLIGPAGIGFNCNSPNLTGEVLSSLPADIRRMVLGIHPNASSERDPRQYAKMTDLHAIPEQEYVSILAGLQREFNIPIIGGCCGTNHETMRQLSNSAQQHL